MKPQRIHILSGFLLFLLPLAGIAQQPAIEFASGTGPTGSGYSSANQVVTFQENALNPTIGTYIPLSPIVTATFSISNQQYVLPATQNPSGADVVFGGNVSSVKTPTSMALYTPMNTVSSPQAPQFSATQDNIGTGMSMTDNYAIELFTSAMGLVNAGSLTSGTYYMANLTITFSAPISYPVIHIVGLGGTAGALGMTTQLTLITTGLTLTKLSGSPEFSVTGGTQIINTASTVTSTTAAGAASGSVMVNGSSVTSLVFQIYLRGDGKAPTWGNTNETTGDAWLIGVSALNTFVALPIGTTSFTAEPQAHSVNLQWTTETQQNSKYFTVQRSQDGNDWTDIGQVNEATSNQTSQQYNYVDGQPFTGSNYYRLRETDDNGAAIYSPVRNVTFNGAATAISWYPNPVHDRVTITSAGTLQSVTLITLDGRILQVFNGFASGQTVDMSRYPFGIYFLIIRSAGGQSSVAKIERD